MSCITLFLQYTQGGNCSVFADFLKAMTLTKQGERHSPLFLAAPRDSLTLPLRLLPKLTKEQPCDQGKPNQTSTQ